MKQIIIEIDAGKIFCDRCSKCLRIPDGSKDKWRKFCLQFALALEPYDNPMRCDKCLAAEMKPWKM